MQDHYQTLFTIYEIVKDDAQPFNYQCSTRDIILHHKGGWQQEHLDALVREGMIEFKQHERLFICITEIGFDKARSLTPVLY